MIPKAIRLNLLLVNNLFSFDVACVAATVPPCANPPLPPSARWGEGQGEGQSYINVHAFVIANENLARTTAKVKKISRHQSFVSFLTPDRPLSSTISCRNSASSWASFLFFSDNPEMTEEKCRVISKRNKKARRKRNEGG